MNRLLEINNLTISFDQQVAVKNLSLSLDMKEVLGIVGESGSGKSVTLLSIARLPKPGMDYTADLINFDGKDLLNMSDDEFRALRGHAISMVFQDPMNALNPTQTIGKQLEEVFEAHGLQGDHKPYIIEMMKDMGLPRAESLYEDYPHELSGGMLQRVLIAMAMLLKPKMILADEPTTALDVSSEALILKLMKKLKEKYGTSIILISHDMRVIEQVSDRIMVFYLGNMVEMADRDFIINHPKHPYTHGLMQVNNIDKTKDEGLYTIAGRVPTMGEDIQGCPFHPRCFRRQKRCEMEKPLITGTVHQVACFYPLGDDHA